MKHLIIVIFLLIPLFSMSKNYIYDIEKLGYKPETCTNFSPVIADIISKIRLETSKSDNITIKFSEGKYKFKNEGCSKSEYYISNHDQVNPRTIAMDLSGIDNLTVDGDGAEFLFEGRILPIVATNCKNLLLKNFSIDFPNPQIIQMDIVKNLGEDGMICYLAPWVQYDIDNKNRNLLCKGNGWECTPKTGIVFNRETKNIIYNFSDISINTLESDSIENRIIECPKWIDSRLKTGMTIASRGTLRCAPGIFLDGDKNTFIEDVTVHYAEGMGLIAQGCEDISLLRFKVSLSNSQRCFTTYADATHFSGCKGKIISTGGLYENMMDDAINVHGTYLKIVSISEDRKNIVAKYMHEQSYGFNWGETGDSISLINSSTLETVHQTKISSISPNGNKTEFNITVTDSMPSEIENGYAVENTTWTPEVEFTNNIVKNNRARGCLFSTPRKVLVKDNLFSHISGCAILLCGDCNGWFESGACKDVTITKNRFIDVLTSMFQFTEAIISIYPVIPSLDKQKGYFHSGIKIEDNYFETFDRPILYAKSVNGLIFRKNLIYGDTRYKPYHHNGYTFNFSRVSGYKIEDNTYSKYEFDEKKDIHLE